jgi:hypothetical protein
MDKASVETIPRYSVRNSKAQSNVGEERATEISGAGTGYGRFLFHADFGELGELGQPNDSTCIGS